MNIFFFVSGEHGMSCVCEYFLPIRYDQGRAPDIALLYMDARLDGHRHTFEIELSHALCLGEKKKKKVVIQMSLHIVMKKIIKLPFSFVLIVR